MLCVAVCSSPILFVCVSGVEGHIVHANAFVRCLCFKVESADVPWMILSLLSCARVYVVFYLFYAPPC